MKKTGEYLRWVGTILRSPASRRKMWVDEIFAAFRSYRKKGDDKTIPYISDMLADKNQFELIGFVPKTEYIKVEGPDDELDVVWTHPHMNPHLLYKHKTLPLLIIAGPGIKFNEDGARGIIG